MALDKKKIEQINEAVDAATEATGDPVTGFIVKFFIIIAIGAVSPPLMVPAVIVALIL